MIQSMTAYARKESQSDWGRAAWEIRSVNHRFLDLTIRLPDELKGLELQLRDLMRLSVMRGKVECTLRLELGNVNNTEIKFNEILVKKLLNTASKISALSKDCLPVTCIDLMHWPDVLKTEELDLERVAAEVLQLFERSIQDLIEARAREGQALQVTILQRLKIIEEKILHCEQLLPDIMSCQRERLLTRFHEAKIELDDYRLEQEMVIWAQKMDIAEEMDRLRAHVKEVRRTLETNDSIGRRLDFLLQEMNREANTLGAKSIAGVTSHISVDLKVLIEQIREQVQNIE